MPRRQQHTQPDTPEALDSEPAPEPTRAEASAEAADYQKKLASIQARYKATTQRRLEKLAQAETREIDELWKTLSPKAQQLVQWLNDDGPLPGVDPTEGSE